MQNAEVILSILSQKSIQDSNYVFDRLYRNLFNPDMYALAFQNVCAFDKAVARGRGDGMRSAFSLAMMQETIDLLRREAYYPLSLRAQSVSIKDALSHVPGKQLFLDRLVQEVVRMLLQAIYEPLFMDSSHGFRPGRNYHTALVQAKIAGRGKNWAIAGNIEGLFGVVCSERLRTFLARKISDGRFLNLVNKFLVAGYMEVMPVHTSFVGVSDNYTVASMLANVYFHELDVHMQSLCVRVSSESGKVAGRSFPETIMPGLLARISSDDTSAYKFSGPTEQESFGVSFELQPIRVSYVRYADAFVIMVAGNRDLARQIQCDISEFLERELALEISHDKMDIIHLLDQKVRFLGYDITRSRMATRPPVGTRNRKKHAASETIQLLVPSDMIREKLRPFVANGKATHHKARLHLPLLDILQQYNEEIRSLYHYYCLATDVSTKIGKFKYYHYASLVKTVARKENVSVARIMRTYGVDVKRQQGSGTRKIFGVSYMAENGPQTLTYFQEPIRFCRLSA